MIVARKREQGGGFETYGTWALAMLASLMLPLVSFGFSTSMWIPMAMVLWPTVGFAITHLASAAMPLWLVRTYLASAVGQGLALLSLPLTVSTSRVPVDDYSGADDAVQQFLVETSAGFPWPGVHTDSLDIAREFVPVHGGLLPLVVNALCFAVLAFVGMLWVPKRDLPGIVTVATVLVIGAFWIGGSQLRDLFA
ncbi:MAG: hypothetical protein RL148_1913 [Planctomycetota bacterium]|jgi:hypothetical protein